MIPKKIHYCWFGGNPLPESVQKCIDSWEKYCPDYEIIQWNETNYNVNKNIYMKEAFIAQKYAFVSDYARLDIIFEHGGIYLDTDVELLKSLTPLLDNECFMGMELVGRVATGLGFGAIKHSKFLAINLQQYDNEHFFYNKKMNNKTCIDYTSDALEQLSYSILENKIYEFDTIKIFPTEFLCPFNIETRKINITRNTYAIHHYDASWYSGNSDLKKKLIPLKIKIKKGIDYLFGKGTYNKLKDIFK